MLLGIPSENPFSTASTRSRLERPRRWLTYPLTDRCQFDILQITFWLVGHSNATQSIATARVDDAARRHGRLRRGRSKWEGCRRSYFYGTTSPSLATDFRRSLGRRAGADWTGSAHGN